MKTRQSYWKKVLMVSSVVLCSAVVLSSCDKDDDDDNNNRVYTISGNASGSQMSPAVTTNGTGAITGTYDANSHVMNYTTTWTNLSGAPTTAGFYNGASGMTGTAVGSSWNLGSNLTGTGTFTGSMTLTDEQASQLTAGNWYYSYGTSTNPNGEVRGQISATAQ